MRPISPRKIFITAVTTVVIAVLVILAGRFVEYLDASHLMVIQYPTGKLMTHTAPGIKPQWFGSVTKYTKRDQFWFSISPEQGKKEDQSIQVRFNDGGHAKISGSIAWEMPMDYDNIIKLHTRYRSHIAIQQQLIRTVLEKSVYMTGPLMSSKESYAERRNDLLNLINDQLVHGVYKTETKQIQEKDPMTGAPKTVSITSIIMEGGKALRQDEAPLEEFGIKTFNLSINQVTYDATVEGQIKQQQQAIMQVQTAVAEAKQAEQRAITAAKEGEANAAKAKWEQEVLKAKAVTLAQQELEVATLKARAAEQTKRESILLGEGEATRKRLVMEADGALAIKLEALVKINEFYANAIKDYEGNWVPSIIMGGSADNRRPGSGAQEMIDLLTANTARQLGVDLGLTGKERTTKGKGGTEKKSAPPSPVQTQ